MHVFMLINAMTNLLFEIIAHCFTEACVCVGSAVVKFWNTNIREFPVEINFTMHILVFSNLLLLVYAY